MNTTVWLMLLFLLVNSAVAQSQIEIQGGKAISGRPYENTLVKRLWNTYYLAFDPDQLAKVLPHRAYNIKDLKQHHCEDSGDTGYGNLPVGREIGLVRSVLKETSAVDKQATRFEGVQVRISPPSVEIKVSDVCGWIQKPDQKLSNIARHIQDVQAISEPLGGVLRTHEELPDEARLLMSGRFVTRESKDDIVWTVKKFRETERKLAWQRKSAGTASSQGESTNRDPRPTVKHVWKLDSDDQDDGTMEFYVGYSDMLPPDAPSEAEATSLLHGNSFKWERAPTHAKVADNHFSFWYVPSSKNLKLDGNWYLLTDEPLPRLDTVHRVAHGALQQPVSGIKSYGKRQFMLQ